MSFNGSGLFQVNSAGQPVVTATVISSTVFNAYTADVATGLSTCITKDGQTSTTARIPFASGINSTLATDATNTTTGSILTAGGVGIVKALWVGGLANIAGALTLQSTLAVTGHATLEGVTSTGATGTGALVFATSPTLVTPVLGVATGTRLGLGAAADATYLLNLNGALVHGTSNGVGIGETSPNAVGLHIKKASADVGLFIERTTDVASTSKIYLDANGDLILYQLNAAKKINFITNDVTPFTIESAGTLTLLKKVGKYNNITAVGQGVPSIYGSGRSIAQTNFVTSVATYTNGATDGSFIVSANVNVTTSTAHNFTVNCTYTDETNTSRTLILAFVQLAGTIVSAITNVTGAGPYEGIPVHIRCKASTAITISTASNFTTVTYNVEGYITQIG